VVLVLPNIFFGLCYAKSRRTDLEVKNHHSNQAKVVYHLHSTYLPVWFWVLGSHQERCTQDRRPRPWCLRKLLGIKWYHHVRNDEVRRTTGQPRLSAIVQAWRLSLFGHVARMPDETDARSVITASPSENWRRPPGRPRTTWMKTMQQDLRSNNLSLDEAITVTQNRPLWRLMSAFGATHP